MSRPTLKDVAARAGLSVTQVSRALNDRDDVAPATKELARRVARELEYTPNLEARRLRDPDTRTNSIGIVLPNESLRFNDPFFGDMLTAMVSEAGSLGCQLTLSTNPKGTPASAPYELVNQLQQVDGFVLLRTTEPDPRVEVLRSSNFPFVTLGRPGGETDFPAVEIAKDCFLPIVDHLLELGHRKVVCLAEPAQYTLGAARLGGFLWAAKQRGLEMDADSVVRAGFHEGSGRVATRELLSRPDRPTAIAAMNDLLALGALEAAAELGVRVPSDLSITGFDDIPAARAINPALTTVRQSATEVGNNLIRLLIARVQANEVTESTHCVATSAVFRESCARAAD